MKTENQFLSNVETQYAKPASMKFNQEQAADININTSHVPSANGKLLTLTKSDQTIILEI